MLVARSMPDSELGVIVLVFFGRLLLDSSAWLMENLYLTGRGVSAACLSAMLVLIGTPLARILIADRNDGATIAAALAVFVATLIGSRDYSNRKTQQP